MFNKRHSKFYVSLMILMLMSLVQINAQDFIPGQLWTGLKQPQPQSELPKGKAPFQTSERVAKRNIPTALVPVQSGEWIISDGWEMTDGKTAMASNKSIFDPQYNTSAWYNATVPGTVLTTLVNQGVYADPYFGLNNMNIPESLSRTDWWYRCKFTVPKDIDGNQLRLLFNGINYKADIYLNGKSLGDMKGAFIRGEFNITDLVNKNGENILAVHVFPPHNPGIPHEQSMIAGQGLNGGVLSTDGPTFISSIGWDWIPGIRDRNTGIWQDVRLKVGGDIIIGDPLVTTDILLPDTTQAKISIKNIVKNITSKTVNGTLTAKIENINISLPFTLAANEEKEITFTPEQFKELNIKNPRLWWPNGYGRPELYNLDLTVEANNKVSDTKSLKFGIREMSYELMVNDNSQNKRVLYTPNETVNKGKPVFDYINRVAFTKDNNLPTIAKDADTSGLQPLSNDDPVGPFFAIRVNGVRIFCRGGNWGMDDGMKRVSRERLEPYIRLHKDANFNIIRNWTGETTEEDFYALCDEYGMLVWNDFWITTDDTVEPSDFPLFVKNATDAVRRFRNHPSIAVWCPRNEGFAPKQLEESISAMMAKEDPTRHYHGQSRFLNMGTSGPWGYFKDPSKYYTENAKGFNTEMGSYAIPTANTIRKFIAPEDQWPINDVWAYHDLHHTTQNFGDFINAVDRYGKAESMEDFSRKSQFVTYDAWRNMLEAWNSKMWNNTTGLILWMSHPAWPSMIWQTYTYDYETPGSYFGAKKACEPIHIQMNLPENDVMIINTTLNDYKSVTAGLRFIDLQGKELYKKNIKLDSKANSATKCFVPEKGNNLPQLYLARLELKDAKGKVLSINDYWMTNGDKKSYEAINTLSSTTVIIKTISSKGKTWVEVSNPSKTLAVAVKLNVVDKNSKEILLPAYFSDGYINLLGGEKRLVELDIPKSITNYNIVAEGYNTKSK
ncbi:MAG TPA: glycoside hydrolase family 2 TIM barrel-domain containing protein [Dysgonomonas sp.]|uniref:glycoside hydrolase family 2 protein n=1 Tax=Dysgonomonas sp. TaxID=1891233 RepID=UPI002CAEA2AB|nr:sugar-binding domain-containing protein [Dysgonomonas sp.]HML65104.1 glycoside hydrolase family 2 TIM barrel-domain containing protein [Dysgonomonas sp.]